VNGTLVVYDTMVFLQAAVHPERRYATFEAIEDKRVTLCTSSETIAEVGIVLLRPALATKFAALTPERVSHFLDLVNAAATSFSNVPRVFTWPHHPDDDHIFNLAIHSKAKYLVTWETRILKLATDTTPAADLLRKLAPDLAIITPKQLADLLKSPSP
jgi:putative PIN family toxin of toxin-antitoxin system